MCNGKGAIVTVVKSSGGYIFEGYTDVSWRHIQGFRMSSESFLFSLKDHAGIGPVKMPIKSGKTGHAVYHLQVMAQLLEAVLISSLPRMQMQILHLLVMLAIPITTSWLDQRTSLYQSSKSFSFNPITLGLLVGVLHFTDDSIHFTRWIRVQ